MPAVLEHALEPRRPARSRPSARASRAAARCGAMAPMTRAACSAARLLASACCACRALASALACAPACRVAARLCMPSVIFDSSSSCVIRSLPSRRRRSASEPSKRAFCEMTLLSWPSLDVRAKYFIIVIVERMFLAVSVGDRLHAKEKKRTRAEERERHVSTERGRSLSERWATERHMTARNAGRGGRDAYTPRRHAPWVAAGRFHLRPAWIAVAKKGKRLPLPSFAVFVCDPGPSRAPLWGPGIPRSCGMAASSTVALTDLSVQSHFMVTDTRAYGPTHGIRGMRSLSRCLSLFHP